MPTCWPYSSFSSDVSQKAPSHLIVFVSPLEQTPRVDAPFLDLVTALASHLTPVGVPHPDPERIMLWLDFFALDLHQEQVCVCVGGVG